MRVGRVGARILLLDKDGRVLLIQECVEGPEQKHWLTPGGGVEPGEDLALAAAREVFEETGIQIALPPGAPVVHRHRRQWSWHGVIYDQLDHFFLATVTGPPAISPMRLTAMERQTLIGHRWWSADDLRDCTDTVEPPDLAELLIALCPSTDGSA
jgi:8-oxo-dGTP pyrophosphatase MutT (NUDIX family)